MSISLIVFVSLFSCNTAERDIDMDIVIRKVLYVKVLLLFFFIKIDIQSKKFDKYRSLHLSSFLILTTRKLINLRVQVFFTPIFIFMCDASRSAINVQALMCN